MVICFEIAKNRDKKEQAFHNDCPFKPLKPLLITNINQTIVVRSLISLHATYPISYVFHKLSVSIVVAVDLGLPVPQAMISQSDSVPTDVSVYQRNDYKVRHNNDDDMLLLLLGILDLHF